MTVRGGKDRYVAGDTSEVGASGSVVSGLTIPDKMANVLRPHQISALHFMWKKLVEKGFLPLAARSLSASIEQRVLLYEELYGCIIGHSMGLGKTLTAISFVILFQSLVSALVKNVSDESSSGDEGIQNVYVSADDVCLTKQITGSSMICKSVDASKTAVARALRVLIISPKSCVLHWELLLRKWLNPDFADAETIKILDVFRITNRSAIKGTLEQFYERGGFLILSYEEYLQLVETYQSKLAPDGRTEVVEGSYSSCVRVSSTLDQLRAPLPYSMHTSKGCGNDQENTTVTALIPFIDILESPDILILDEAHRLRRETSKTVIALRRHTRRTQLRIALTGTPFQNHLGEYNLMQSVVTGCAVEAQKFSQLFIQPIARGQCVDSTYQQFTEMQQCVATLRRFFSHTVHYAGPEVLEAELPPRKEFVLFFSLSADQEEEYKKMLHIFKTTMWSSSSSSKGMCHAAGVTDQKNRSSNYHSIAGTIHLHHEASHIACHPSLSISYRKDVEIHKENSSESMSLPLSPSVERGVKRERCMGELIDLDELSSQDEEEEDMEGGDGVFSRRTELYPPKRKKRVGDGVEENGTPGNLTRSLMGEAFPLLPSSASSSIDMSSSPKLQFTIELINHIVNNLGEKVIVFSQYTSHLHLISKVLQDKRRINAPIFSGQLSDVERQRLIEMLNRGVQCRVLLCSLRAGGVGIDLVTANHCIIFDVSWNPADDIQAAFRIYRFGQTRPVTVYRLATYGTSEQVVFAYALQKSWLHKKIADVRDPTRQQRHRTRNYMEYPCELPMHTLPELEKMDEEAISPSQREEKRQQFILQWCTKRCSSVSHVLYVIPSLLPSLRNIFKHSFLLRDDSAEIIRRMEKRFDVDWHRVKALSHLPTSSHRVSRSTGMDSSPTLTTSETSYHESKKTQKGAWMDECENKLVGKAQRAAFRLICGALRHASVENTTRIARTEDVTAMESCLLSLLSSLLPAPHGVPPSDPPSQLVEWFMRIYQIGVGVLLQEVLNTPQNSHFRSILSQHLAKNEYMVGKIKEERIGSSSSPLSLRYALECRPHRLLSAFSGVELMHMATELGFCRPIIPQLMFLGITKVWKDWATKSADPHFVLRFLQLFGLRHEETMSPTTSSASNLNFNDRSTIMQLCKEAIECIEDCLSEEWPAFSGFKKPTIPFQLSHEEKMARHALASAKEFGSSQSFTLFQLKKAAELLGLHAFQGQRNVYVCPRCSDATLVTGEQLANIRSQYSTQVTSSVPKFSSPSTPAPFVGGTGLFCPRCHYNAEFELRNLEQCHHHAVIYQLSVICNLLDAFSVSKSFLRSFSIKGCSSLFIALQRQKGAVPVLDFVQKCLKDGAAMLVSEFPSSLTYFLVTQSGADNADHLKRLLCANSRLLWAKNVKENLRRSLLEEYRVRISPSQRFANASMPFLLLVLALHISAQEEGITYAYELLGHRDHGPSSVSHATEGRTVSAFGGVGWSAQPSSHRSQLLRFACEALVKLLYIERLLLQAGVSSPYVHKRTLMTTPLTVNALRDYVTNAAESSDSSSLYSSNSASSSSSFDFAHMDSASVSSIGLHSNESTSRPGVSSGRAEKAIEKESSSSLSPPVSLSDENEEHSSGSGRSGSDCTSHKDESSSFGTCYSSDRSSFVKEDDLTDDEDDKKIVRADHLSPTARDKTSRMAQENAIVLGDTLRQKRNNTLLLNRGNHLGDAVKEGNLDGSSASPTMFKSDVDSDTLISEGALQAQSSYYWVAFCEVFGTLHTDATRIIVEGLPGEGTGGSVTRTLAPPPPRLWLPHLQNATAEGLTVTEAIDKFLEKIRLLSESVPLL